MTLYEKIEKEFDEKFCVETNKGKILRCKHIGGNDSQNNIKQFIHSALRRVAEEAIKSCELKEKDLGWQIITERDKEDKIKDRGYNTAIYESKEQAKKFLEDNF